MGEDRDALGARLAALDRAVDAVYEVHDYIFGSEKQALLQALIRDVEELADGLLEVPRACLLLGRALDALKDHDARAEELLTRAAKRDPLEKATWTALGHCLWKRDDLDGAASCYERAVSLGCATAARSLSQIARLQGRIADGVQLAKAAVAADVTSSQSWAILGNALLVSFIAVGRDAATLESAHRAFSRARMLEVAESERRSREGLTLRAGNPDLRFNQAQARLYSEDVADAIEGFTAAARIDPTLPAADAIAGARKRAVLIADSIAARSRLPPKRVVEATAAAAKAAEQLPLAAMGRSSVTLAALQGASNPDAPDSSPAHTTALTLVPLAMLPTGGAPPL